VRLVALAVHLAGLTVVEDPTGSRLDISGGQFVERTPELDRWTRGPPPLPLGTRQVSAGSYCLQCAPGPRK
jgi:hypothetical protein